VNANNVPVKGSAFSAGGAAAPDMLFNGRSGNVRLLTLADSGATGCILGRDSAARMGLSITPTPLGGEGFQCANEGTLAILGTARMPLTIQRYMGSVDVHVVDQLPSGIELILGSDWMKREKVIIDYDRMVLAIKRHGCSLIPINQLPMARPSSFFAQAVANAEHSTADPTMSAKAAWKELKKVGTSYTIVNVRKQAEYPDLGTAAGPPLPRLALPPPLMVANLPSPSVPPVKLAFEDWLTVNVPEHTDPLLVPAAQLKDFACLV
jgi:hypothetical protein